MIGQKRTLHIVKHIQIIIQIMKPKEIPFSNLGLKQVVSQEMMVLYSLGSKNLELNHTSDKTCNLFDSTGGLVQSYHRQKKVVVVSKQDKFSKVI